jgi:hypothetical protein
VRTQKANGQWTTQTIQVPVAADGTATIESGPHQRTGGSRITKVEYTVVSVDLDGGGAWDQSQSSLTIAAPA